jgi:hypothetical protein
MEELDNCSSSTDWARTRFLRVMGLFRFSAIPNARVFHRGGGISVFAAVERQPKRSLILSR